MNSQHATAQLTAVGKGATSLQSCLAVQGSNVDLFVSAEQPHPGASPVVVKTTCRDCVFVGRLTGTANMPTQRSTPLGYQPGPAEATSYTIWLPIMRSDSTGTVAFPVLDQPHNTGSNKFSLSVALESAGTSAECRPSDSVPQECGYICPTLQRPQQRQAVLPGWCEGGNRSRFETIGEVELSNEWQAATFAEDLDQLPTCDRYDVVISKDSMYDVRPKHPAAHHDDGGGYWKPRLFKGTPTPTDVVRIIATTITDVYVGNHISRPCML